MKTKLYYALTLLVLAAAVYGPQLGDVIWS